MGFWRDVAFTAAGYGIHELVDRKKEQSQPKKTLEDVIDDYAHAHDIWGRDEHFYRQLLKIIEKYHDPYDKDYEME